MFTIVRVMSSPSTPARGRPARLDRTRTVDTALELLDEVGLDALTMRRLADAMDVQAGALYRYFATKGDLLTAMAERMLADLAAAKSDGDWSEQLASLARGMRRALLARRDGARVYAGTHATGPHTLGFAEAVVGVLRTAGFGAQEAARTLMAVAHLTIGHTLEEQAALQPVGVTGRRIPSACAWRPIPSGIRSSPPRCPRSRVRTSRRTSNSGCPCSCRA